MQIDLEPKRREPVFQQGGVIRLILFVGLVVGSHYAFHGLSAYFNTMH